MISEDLKGKKVLVTGSSSGIGATRAAGFARQVCFVGVHYFKTKAGGIASFEKKQGQYSQYWFYCRPSRG